MGDPAIYTNDFTRLLPAPQFFALSSFSMYAFWIIGILLIGAISYFLYTGLDRQVSGTLFFILGFLLLYFYYVKWFIIGNKNRGLSTELTPCPDYLTYFTVPASGTTPARGYCLDFVGVSRNGQLAKCDSDAATCIQRGADTNGRTFTFDPLSATDKDAKGVLNLGAVQDRTVAAGLIWPSLLGDI
jgi:hypothetical protein